MVNWFNIFGLLLTMVGVILLAHSFRIEHDKGIKLSGKPAIALTYYNKKRIILSWILIIIGYLSQITGDFLF